VRHSLAQPRASTHRPAQRMLGAGAAGHTYSIVARCARTGMVGAAITSSSIAVGSRCIFAAPGVGAVATQNYTDPRLGRLGLDLLRRGYSAQATLDQLVQAGRFPEHRQIACVDFDGGSAAHSGSRALPVYAELTASDVAVAGNLLAGPEVVQSMLDSFTAHPGDALADRLVNALAAGYAAGGEVGHAERAAAVLVFDRDSFPAADLRIDWDEQDPVSALRSLLGRFTPEARTFERWAKNPTEVTDAH